MPVVTFRLPPATHERFVAQCEERSITVSDFLRQAVDRFVDLMEEPSSLIFTTASVAVQSPKAEPVRGIRGFSVTSGEAIPNGFSSRFKTDKKR